GIGPGAGQGQEEANDPGHEDEAGAHGLGHEAGRQEDPGADHVGADQADARCEAEPAASTQSGDPPRMVVTMATSRSSWATVSRTESSMAGPVWVTAMADRMSPARGDTSCRTLARPATMSLADEAAAFASS